VVLPALGIIRLKQSACMPCAPFSRSHKNGSKQSSPISSQHTGHSEVTLTVGALLVSTVMVARLNVLYGRYLLLLVLLVLFEPDEVVGVDATAGIAVVTVVRDDDDDDVVLDDELRLVVVVVSVVRAEESPGEVFIMRTNETCMGLKDGGSSAFAASWALLFDSAGCELRADDVEGRTAETAGSAPAESSSVDRSATKKSSRFTESAADEMDDKEEEEDDVDRTGSKSLSLSLSSTICLEKQGPVSTKKNSDSESEREILQLTMASAAIVVCGRRDWIVLLLWWGRHFKVAEVAVVAVVRLAGVIVKDRGRETSGVGGDGVVSKS
jgi:hypothetical protein